jgi:hypothetical protein
MRRVSLAFEDEENELVQQLNVVATRGEPLEEEGYIYRALSRNYPLG